MIFQFLSSICDVVLGPIHQIPKNGGPSRVGSLEWVGKHGWRVLFSSALAPIYASRVFLGLHKNQLVSSVLCVENIRV
jgi:hypothetical protein